MAGDSRGQGSLRPATAGTVGDRAPYGQPRQGPQETGLSMAGHGMDGGVRRTNDMTRRYNPEGK